MIATRTRPPLHRPAPEVVVDLRDLLLDRRPERPAHVGHEGVQLHAGEEAVVSGAEVRLAEDCSQVVVELTLLRCVRELEGRVVVSRVLVVEQPERRAVVDVVLGEQVVVARHRGSGVHAHRALDVGDRRHAVLEPVRDADAALVGRARDIARWSGTCRNRAGSEAPRGGDGSTRPSGGPSPASAAIPRTSSRPRGTRAP